ncbi:hypothetical protein CDD81_530 [Ophiocordyceps australis]|uniref:F-box domain-containing protein n=1 Tax=Ophiocordyceps australis TaxID=1399860 RepID=A0A2C5Y1L1_9HYPO|nr:hypothetical protein CDD81_530 [Ophiocordyceps australis]
MAQNHPPAAVDSPPSTEFASELYFEKLSQRNARNQQQQQHEALESPTLSSPSTFILPLRESRVSDADAVKPADQKRDKSRFFGLRHKVSLLHSKAPLGDSESAPRSSAATSRKCTLDHLVLDLPSELQAQILSSLPLTDLLNLRLASKSWHALVTLNESPIVRYHLKNHIPAYALRLYPVNDASDYTFYHLCSLWHRLHVAAKLAFMMCEWITKGIFLRQTEAQRSAFQPQHERMRRRLIPLLFTIFHFFETYRRLHIKYIKEHQGRGLGRTPYTWNPIEREIMAMYDDQTLLRVHEVFPLVISSFCRRLRPPTYAGLVERSLRGYIRERPADHIHAAILCLGGLRQVERLWETKGYNSRRTAVDTWYNGLVKELAAETPPPVAKSRLGLKAFGRSKKTAVNGDKASPRGMASEKVKSPSFAPPDTPTVDGDAGLDGSWIFHTSLAADLPMAPLASDAANLVLGDLPVLQQIWLATAEATILERGIVQRTQDIKRNQQLMLDLIREDGVGEEDEWLYGRFTPDSVRPPLGATDDDD